MKAHLGQAECLQLLIGASLIRTLKGHTSDVHSFAFSAFITKTNQSRLALLLLGSEFLSFDLLLLTLRFTGFAECTIKIVELFVKVCSIQVMAAKKSNLCTSCWAYLHKVLQGSPGLRSSRSNT